MSKEPSRIIPSFVVLHDKVGLINPGVSRYVFPTKEAAMAFWRAAGGMKKSAQIEYIACSNKADMINRLNDILVGEQYDKA